MPEEKEEVKMSPHLGLTHMELQGGAANGRNVSLLMKSEGLSEEQKELLLKIVGEGMDAKEEVEKASFVGIKEAIEEAARNAFQGRYSYVVDFDDSTAILYLEDYYQYGLYYINYTIESDGSVSFGGEAKYVGEFLSYEDESGQVVLSEQIPKGVDEPLLKSAVSNINKDEEKKGIFKTKYEEGALMQKEIKKAVEDALGPVQAELLKAKEEKEALQAQLEELHKAAEEREQEARQKALVDLVGEEDAEALTKALKEVEDESFELVVKALQGKEEKLESSHLFKQTSVEGEVEAEQESYTAQLLKQKYSA